MQVKKTDSTSNNITNRIHPGRVEFEEWLQSTHCPSELIKLYANGVDTIGRFLLQNGLEDRNIFSIRGIARLEIIRGELPQNNEYNEYTKNGVHIDLYALKMYIRFRKNDSTGDLDDKEVERFSVILHDYFENGFRVNSLIDRNRFKQY